MRTLILTIIALGIFEVISNFYHFLKGKKESIGLSAKKQHQELSLKLGYQHFFVKAIIMFLFGILFIFTGLIALNTNYYNPLKLVLFLFAMYGLAQSIFYRRPGKVWLSLIVYTLPIILMLFCSGTVKGATTEILNNLSINGQFVFPFSLSAEPIKRLLIINFKDDPQYESIEPQLYNDSIHGSGLRILMYRLDKKIDVYYQQGLVFDSSNFSVGKGLGYVQETPMSPSRFEITEKGVDIDIAFTDYNGRQVELFIKENNTNRNPFPFLAPVGNDVENPSKLFLVYMQEFDFVKRERTEIRAKIGNRNLTPASFPIRRNGEKTYFARYASKLVIGEINKQTNTPIIPDLARKNTTLGNQNFSLDSCNRITKYWIDYDSETIELNFSEGFPNLLSLPQQKKVEGHWSYSVSKTIITGGKYSLIRSGELVNITLNVTSNWIPVNLPFSFKAFTFIMSSFRTWPTTYKWEATIDLSNMTLRGKWYKR